MFGTAGPSPLGKGQLRRASGSTGSMPAAPAAASPRPAPRRARSGLTEAARPRAYLPQAGPSMEVGLLGPAAMSGSSDGSSKCGGGGSSPATGSLHLSDSASSYELDGALAGVAPVLAAASGSRSPSPLQRASPSVGQGRAPGTAAASGALPSLHLS